MANDIAAADPVTLLDVGDERDERGHLLVGKWPIAEFVARIDDLDPDAGRIDVGDPAPARLAGMPGPLVFVDQPVDRAVLVNEIVGRDLRLGRGQPIERALHVGHSGIVKDDHRDRQLPLVEIGRRPFDELQIHAHNGAQLWRLGQAPSAAAAVDPHALLDAASIADRADKGHAH